MQRTSLARYRRSLVRSQSSRPATGRAHRRRPGGNADQMTMKSRWLEWLPK